MRLLILRTAARLLLPLLLLFSVFLLLHGHHDPGGGFAGGLVAASTFALYAIAYDVATARRELQLEPHALIGAGLLLAAGSGMGSLLSGRPFMTGLWGDLYVPGLGKVTLGTPLLFDAGVFLVVLGVGTMIILALAEE